MPRLSPGASVEVDWFACLPEDKLQTFNVYTGDLEARYLLLTVALNKAIALRNAASAEGDSATKSLQLVATTPALWELFANRLQGILYSMEEHTALYNVIPSIASLDPANFRGRSGRRTARLARFFDMFLTSRRARFPCKVRILSEMIVYIGHDFRNGQGCSRGWL